MRSVKKMGGCSFRSMDADEEMYEVLICHYRTEDERASEGFAICLLVIPYFIPRLNNYLVWLRFSFRSTSRASYLSSP